MSQKEFGDKADGNPLHLTILKIPMNVDCDSFAISENFL